MDASQTKVVQYLREAHSSEQALVRVLQSQIAMTPRGSYRNALEVHLRETRDHAARVRERLRQLDRDGNPLGSIVGVLESVAAQALALGKAPLDMLRGSGGEEKVLKNAKDTCASEALEIATYLVIEQLAEAVGDEQTAVLAAEIRADEERMLERVRSELPKLTRAVVRADVKGDPAFDLNTTGAAEAVRAAGDTISDAARSTAASAKQASRQARQVPGVAQAEGELKGAVASEADLPIARYDALTAEEISGRLTQMSQIDLAKIDAYERRHDARTTILGRISALRADEPWPGYDELTAKQVLAALVEGDADRATQVRAYERSHKNRVSVLRATEHEPSNA